MQQCPAARSLAVLAAAVASVAAAAAVGAPAAARAEGLHAFVGAEIRPVSGHVIEDGVLLVEGGRIRAVASRGRVELPAEAVVHDVSGGVLIPGLVDTHSHIGISSRPAVPAHADANDVSGPVQPELRALDALWPDDPGIRMALAGGVTTANVMPGSGNVVGGQTVYVKLRGDTVEEMLAVEGPVLGGLKMANGENPKGVYAGRSQAPMTRMGIAALQRDLFQRALAYQRKWERHREKVAAGEDSEPPERDLALEPVVEVLEGRRTVHHHTHRSDDIVSVLRLRREFGFELVLHHVSEGWKVAEEIARADVPVSLITLDSPGGKPEAARYRLDTAAVLEAAGVKVAIHSDDFITPSRLFLRSAALAVRGGMSEAGALRAVTLSAAEMLGLDERVGSLEPGKDADFVLLSGEPFSVYTQVLETWIEGERVFDRDDPAQRVWATGGVAPAEARSGAGAFP